MEVAGAELDDGAEDEGGAEVELSLAAGSEETGSSLVVCSVWLDDSACELAPPPYNNHLFRRIMQII